MATFSPHPSLTKESNPRDWAYHLCSLPNSDSIVFTKADLLKFLKTHGIEVSPNYNELKKLPQYATVGTFSSSPSGREPAAEQAAPSASLVAPRSAPKPPTLPVSTSSDAVDVTDASGAAFRPTRRVREPIGGGSAQVGQLLGSATEEDNYDPTSQTLAGGKGRRGMAARALDSTESGITSSRAQQQAPTSPDADALPVTDGSGDAFRPTRRVREPIGGGSQQIASLFGGMDVQDDAQDDRIATLGGRGSHGHQAPPQTAAEARAPQAVMTQADLAREQQAKIDASTFRPTRRVREPGGTGGASSIVLG